MIHRKEESKIEKKKSSFTLELKEEIIKRANDSEEEFVDEVIWE